jgi:hypothetical protein
MPTYAISYLKPKAYYYRYEKKTASKMKDATRGRGDPDPPYASYSIGWDHGSKNDEKTA